MILGVDVKYLSRVSEGEAPATKALQKASAVDRILSALLLEIVMSAMIWESHALVLSRVRHSVEKVGVVAAKSPSECLARIISLHPNYERLGLDPVFFKILDYASTGKLPLLLADRIRYMSTLISSFRPLPLILTASLEPNAIVIGPQENIDLSSRIGSSYTDEAVARVSRL